MLPRTAALVAGALCAGVGLSHDAAPHRRPMELFSVSYLGANFAVVPGNSLPFARGVAADVLANGDVVDKSTGVEVQTTGGQPAAGITATITTRTNSLTSGCLGSSCAHLGIHVTSTSPAALGSYKILIHYLVEFSGPEKFDIQLLDRGTVSSVAITAPAPLSDGAYRVGDNLTFQVVGTELSNAGLSVDTAHGMHVIGTGSVSASSATYTIRFDSSGAFAMPLGTLMCDKNLDAFKCGRIPAFYAGSGQFPMVLRVQPRVTSVSPDVPSAGSSITIAGTGLRPKGYATFVDFVPRYKTNSAVVRVGTTAVSGGLQATAPQTPVSPDGALVHFIAVAGSRDSLVTTSVPMPTTRIVGYPPNIIRFDSVGASGARRPALKVGQQVVAGTNLVPDQATVTTTTTTVSSGGGIGGVSVPTINTSISLLPALSFGSTALGVQAVGYSTTSTRLPGTTGADTIVFTVPGTLSDTATKTLTITTPGGSQTTQNVVFVPPPTVTDVRTFNTAGIDVSVGLTGTLVRGKQYRLRGTGLVVGAGSSASSLEAAHATLNGAPLSVTLAPSPNVEAVITIPATASSGPLVVTTFGGVTTVGSFTVTNPPAAITIAGLSVSPTAVTGGQPVVATIAINGTVPPGGSAGNIALTADAGDPVVLPSGLIPVTANPLVISIPTKAVATGQTVSIRASSDPNASPLSSALSALAVQPPSPTSVTFAPPTVAGGTTTRGVVHFNATAPLSAGITVALVNSDPTSATVPANATMNGDSAVFTVNTAVVPADRAVTVTATRGNVSKSATFTVVGARVSAVTVSPASLVPGAGNATVTVTLTGPVPAPTTATVSCVGPLTCPATIPFAQNQSTTSFTVSAPITGASHVVPITVALNGSTAQGSITVTPLALQTLTMSPTSVRASSPSSLTIQLNAPVPTGQSVAVSFASSNPSVVPPPAAITFAPGQSTKLVNIATSTPGTQLATITITATSTQASGTTPITSSKTATLTVTP